MNYQVFALKWRPKKFADIAGQQYVITAIENSFKLNKIHHAYILSGNRGTGKTTIARLFAKGLNCKKSATFDVCEVCQNCKDIDSGCFVDLIEIDAASRTKVEDTHEFLDSIQYAPVQGRFKVYLIDEAHMLSKYSFNALLKTLEEPPKHVKFILITTEYQKIPETVLSRCLQLYVKPLSISEIVSKLQYVCNKEKIIASKNALELLAYSAKGSMRDALNLSEQAILLGNNSITDDIVNNMLGLLHIEESLSLVENLINKDINKIMLQIDHYSIIGINWDFLFEEVLTIFQKIAMLQFSLNSSLKIKDTKKTKLFEERILCLSNTITPEDIQLYYQIFLLGRKELPYSPSDRMGMEMTILRALAFHLTDISTNNKNHENEELFEDPTNSNDKSKIIKKNVDCQKSTENSITLLSLKNKVNEINIEKTKSIKLNKIHSNNLISKILEARSKLMNCKKNYDKSNFNTVDNLPISKESQKTSKKILERFSNLSSDFSKNHLNIIKKK